MQNLVATSKANEPVKISRRAAQLVGELVRYKREVLTPSFIIQQGELAKDSIFHIEHCFLENGQVKLKARIPQCPLFFVIDPSHVELVGN